MRCYNIWPWLSLVVTWDLRTDSHGKTKWRIMWGLVGNGRKLLQLFTGCHNMTRLPSLLLAASHQTIKLHSFQRNLLNCKLSRISHHIITAEISMRGNRQKFSFTLNTFSPGNGWKNLICIFIMYVGRGTSKSRMYAQRIM